MSVQTSAGSTVAIATGLPTTYDATGFAALTYTPVGEVTDIGQYGTTYVATKYTSLASRQTKKFKGSFDNGSMVLKMGRFQTEPGQMALKAALLSDASFSFKVTYQDGTKNYFTGKVMDYKQTIGSVDQITAAETTVEIDGGLVEV
jgi:hypothetical protein